MKSACLRGVPLLILNDEFLVILLLLLLLALVGPSRINAALFFVFR